MMTEGKREIAPGNPEKALTCIHGAYTLTTTPKEGETGEVSDIDNMMIKDFLNTLAEVALTIAARRAEKEWNREPK